MNGWRMTFGVDADHILLQALRSAPYKKPFSLTTHYAASESAIASKITAMKDPMGMGWPKSEALLKEARLPRIAEGLRLHWGFVLALVAAVVVYVIEQRTSFGFEMRAVGSNFGAARFAGVPVNRVLIQTALLSGGLAALAGWSEVAGLKGHLSQDLSPGFGYTGIIVAMLALLNPLAVIGTAIFVAGIFVGSDAMSRAAGVPTYIADMLLASALLFMVLAILLTKMRVVRG
jgi:simple sugar transport system permease protein